MCKTAKDIWNSLVIIHQGNKQVKDNKIDLFVQQYEQYSIFDDETTDCAFARFNTIITSLKALDESFSSRNHVRKFLRALPTKWRPKVKAIEESKDFSTLLLDELIGNLKVYEVVLEKDSEASKNKKEKYKSLALKAKKVSSDEEASSSNSEDEEYAMAVRDFNKFFRRRGKFVRQPHDDKRAFRKAKEDKKGKVDQKCFRCGDRNHFISDCPKHSYIDQKAFVGGSWSDSDEDGDLKKDEICLMAHESNEVYSDTYYYSSYSLDDKTLQNKYNKLCKISLKVINKNKHLKTKIKLLDNEVFKLKERLKKIEKNKAISEECKSCIDLRTKNESLVSKLARFENSNHYLQEMLKNQRLHNDKKGLGFTDHKALTSRVKTEKTSKNAIKNATDDLGQVDPFKRDLASVSKGIRETIVAYTKLKPYMQSRTNFVQITKKTSPNATLGNTKQPPALKLGQGLAKGKIQT
ncbi:zf-CCHC domain-containing protein [Tanacetum coccineum]